MTDDFNNLNSSELTNPAFLADLKAKVRDVVFSYDDKEAFLLSRQLRKILQRTDLTLTDTLFREFKFFFALMAYLSLPAHNDSDLFNLFQNSLLPILTLDQSALLSRLETKFWLVPYGAREEFAEKLIGVMRQNREQLDHLTLGEWLVIYIHQYQSAIELGDLEVSDFITQEEHAKTLNVPQQITLSKLLQIYNYLRPLELNAPYARQILQEAAQGIGDGKANQSEQRLGDALAQTMREESTSRRFTQQNIPDVRDIKTPNYNNHIPPKIGDGFQNQNNYSASFSIPASIKTNSIPASPQSLKPISNNFSAPPTTQEIKSVVPQSPLLKNNPSQVNTFQNPADLKSYPQTSPYAFAEEKAKINSELPAITPNNNFVQGKYPPRTLNKNETITIEILEQAASKDDPVLEEKFRRLIRQDFNKLAPEVRNYVMNSPFWS